MAWYTPQVASTFDVDVASEDGVEADLLAVGEEVGAVVQGLSGGVGWIASPASVAVKLLLDPPPVAVEGVASEAHHVERVYHRHGIGDFLGGGGPEPGEAVHGHHLDLVPPRLGAPCQPRLEHLPGAALGHVQQSRRAGATPDRGEVDDHRHVLVTMASVAPHVLEDPDPVEAARIRDQHAVSLRDDGVTLSVPRHRQSGGDPSDAEMPDDERFERPRQRPTRQPRRGRVLAPHMPVRLAAVAAHRDNQDGGPPPERFVRQPARHAVTHGTLAAATPAPPVDAGDFAVHDRPGGGDTLAVRRQAQTVETAERTRSDQAGRSRPRK